MNNLENEYKNLVSKDIPDLWGRIEAGLEEKKPLVDKTVSSVEENAPVVDNNIEVKNENVVEFAPKKSKFSVGKIITFSSIAAAACMFIIAVPVFLVNNHAGTQLSAPAMDAMCAPAAESANVEYEDVNETAGIKNESVFDGINKGIQSISPDSHKSDSTLESEKNLISSYAVEIRVTEVEPKIMAEIVNATKIESYNDEIENDGIVIGKIIELNDRNNLLKDIYPELQTEILIGVYVNEDGSLAYEVLDA